MKPGQTVLPLIEEALLNVLTTRAQGRENALTWEEIADRVAVVLVAHSIELSRGALIRRCQEAAQELRAKSHPVAGLSKAGIFLAETEDERKACRREWLGRIVQNAKGLRAFDRATAEAILGQLRLEEAA